MTGLYHHFVVSAHLFHHFYNHFNLSGFKIYPLIRITDLLNGFQNIIQQGFTIHGINRFVRET